MKFSIFTLAAFQFIYLTASALSAQISSQEYESAAALIHEKSFDTARKVIETLGKEHPSDPEYFVLMFNLYLAKSIPDSAVENLRAGNINELQADTIGRDTIKSSPPQGSLHYDFDSLMAGIRFLDSGIARYPDRLDMYLGKAYVLSSSGQFRPMCTLFINLLNHGDSISNRWLWSFSAPYLGSTKELLLETMQSRIYDLWSLESPLGDSLITEMSSAMIAHFPDHIYGYASLGNIYNYQGKFDTALKLYKQAHEIDSTDIVVIGNLTVLNGKMADTTESVRFFRLLKKLGSTEQVEMAKSQVEFLNNRDQ